MSEWKSATGEVTHTRIFEAPRELVFRCWIEPEHLTHFWSPVGLSTPIGGIKVDARPGGSFEITSVDDASGKAGPRRGQYVEVVEPERLVWTEYSIVTTLTFVDLGDGRTELRLHQANVPELYLGPEAQARFVTSFDLLAAHLKTVS
jgi:uncharacterized protein YndB with AHSA1/START domain